RDGAAPAPRPFTRRRRLLHLRRRRGMRLPDGRRREGLPGVQPARRRAPDRQGLPARGRGARAIHGLGFLGPLALVVKRRRSERSLHARPPEPIGPSDAASGVSLVFDAPLATTARGAIHSFAPAKETPMRILQRIGIALAVFVALVVIGGFFVPSSWQVEESVEVAAAPVDILPLVETPRRWEEWAAWTKARYPDMESEYAGPERGAGAIWRWRGRSSGNGTLEITKSDPASGIDYVLTFEGFSPTP